MALENHTEAGMEFGTFRALGVDATETFAEKGWPSYNDVHNG